MEPAEKENEVKPVREEPEKDLFVWTEASRPFKRRDKQFYTTIIAVASVVGLIFFLVEGAMPVVTLISVVFLFYVMSTIEPEKIEYKITNKGIKIAGRITEWSLTRRFWFSKRFDANLLVVETFFLPGRLEMVVNSEDIEKIRKAVSGFIPEEEVSPSNLDRAVAWFSRKLPQS